MIEAASVRHNGIERTLPGMAEGRVPEIVGKRQGLGQILIDTKRPRHGAGDLRHLETMGEPRAVVIALVIDEHLGLVGEPTEGGRMQDAVAVAAVKRARGARRLWHEAPPALAARPRRRARDLMPAARSHPSAASWHVSLGFCGCGRLTSPAAILSFS